MADFLELPPGEQAFHQAHLVYRQVLQTGPEGLADIHASLRRIEGLLGGLDFSALAALKHLAPMRRALDDIADAQSEVLEALEDQGGGEDEDVRDDDAPPDGEEGGIEDDAPEDDAEEEPVTWDAPGEEGAPEVVVPEIVEPPPAEAPAPRKPRRPRVIDVPSSEAA